MQDQNHIFFDELSIIFSQERLDEYLSHAKCNNSKTDALIAYSWNIELSQALYPSLQILEISLRNSLHQAISESFQTEHWFDHHPHRNTYVCSINFKQCIQMEEQK